MKSLVLIVLIIILSGIFYYFSTEHITSLEPPIIKGVSGKYGASLPLEGTAYPHSKVLIYINGQYTDDAPVDDRGSFSKTLLFTTNGKKSIKTRQTYKNVMSDYSEEYKIETDVTPPDDKDFTLTTKFPESDTKGSILIKGTGSPNDFLIIDDQKFQISDDGTFELTYYLSEGENDLGFAMEDAYGNRTNILERHAMYVDSTPPVISNYFHPTNKGATQESVVINIGQWQGYLDSVNSVAITGSIQGKVKSITVDGKNISWDENNAIYERVNLFIYGGINKYKVVVEDMAGNLATSYVETTAERDTDELNVNLND